MAVAEVRRHQSKAGAVCQQQWQKKYIFFWLPCEGFGDQRSVQKDSFYMFKKGEVNPTALFSNKVKCLSNKVKDL